MDLGCGSGVDTVYLAENGIGTIACDFSDTALSQLSKLLPEAKALCFDMTNGLPFETDSTNAVIADLSLHYFKWDITLGILKEIQRMLIDGGHLLCRVNATEEYSPSLNDIELEKHYYSINGFTKKGCTVSLRFRTGCAALQRLQY